MMKDAMDGRLWAVHHARVPDDAGLTLGKAGTPAKLRRDPMPVVGRALALALAASVAGLTLGATIA